MYKVVVFDMDETLGCFVEIGMFWDAVNNILGEKSEEHFFEIIDLFPLFLRPHILDVLKYLLEKKQLLECNKILIYTNNQGHKSWAELISKYFNNKLNNSIFDQVIGAFKINGDIIEVCRTTHSKTKKDLFNCANLPEDTQVCFIDDQYHPSMIDESISYIYVKPYEYSLDFNKMAERYFNKFKNTITLNKEDFIKDITKYMNRFNYNIKKKSVEEHNIDIIVSKKIIKNLGLFL